MIYNIRKAQEKRGPNIRDTRLFSIAPIHTPLLIPRLYKEKYYHLPMNYVGKLMVPYESGRQNVLMSMIDTN